MSLDLPQAVHFASAIRFELALQPPGGSTQKIFPPTYPAPRNGGREVHAEYATEQRLIGGEQADVALLDSIPSQANRLEQALLTAHKARDLPLPVVQVDIDGYGTITDLDAPHRVYDAILIDSLLDGQPFLKSLVGSQLAAATTGNATALFRYAPTTLIFGAWNTHSWATGRDGPFSPGTFLRDHWVAHCAWHQDSEPHRSPGHLEVGWRRYV